MKKLSKILIIALSAALAFFAFTACDDIFNPSFDETRPISIVSREPGSGSRDAILEMLFGSTDALNIQLMQGTIIQNSTAAIFTEVSTNPQAIGFESMGHAAGRNEVRMLSVDDYAPTSQNVRDGSYPFSRNLSIVYHAETLLENPAAAAFRDFIISIQAQEVVDERGYVSQIENPIVFTAILGLTGTITISGSTTVHPLMNRLVERFSVIQPQVNVEVAGGGSSAGRNHMRDGISDFGMTSSQVTQSQRENMATGAHGTGRTVRDLTIADDAIAIIVHASNPLENITIYQLRHLFNRDSGTNFTSWAQLKAYEA
ncbi:MAG: substrate-binding domain-containing protein [Firmicutes bacterium]|nr:substrate-binding domain-containing protein [Bacillota bacterium]